MNDYLRLLGENKLTFIMSLPKNDPALCETAFQAGADVVKVHINVEHRASGTRFGRLSEELPCSDAAVISIDRLCFGSLLASREGGVSAEEALARLDWLASIRRRFPAVPFHAFNVIIRC